MAFVFNWINSLSFVMVIVPLPGFQACPFIDSLPQTQKRLVLSYNDINCSQFNLRALTRLYVSIRILTCFMSRNVLNLNKWQIFSRFLESFHCFHWHFQTLTASASLRLSWRGKDCLLFSFLTFGICPSFMVNTVLSYLEHCHCQGGFTVIYDCHISQSLVCQQAFLKGLLYRFGLQYENLPLPSFE